MQNIAASQVNAEIPINENFLSLQWAELFARNPVTSSGLVWGYVGGLWPINGVMTLIAGGTLALTANQAAIHIGVNQAGGLSATNATANPALCPLYTLVTGATAVTSYTDLRNATMLQRHSQGEATFAMGDANQTLSAAQALCETLSPTGALTATRDIVAPLVRRRWVVRNKCTGFGVQVIGATGAGVTVAPLMSAVLECDGTNVLRVTADV